MTHYHLFTLNPYPDHPALSACIDLVEIKPKCAEVPVFFFGLRSLVFGLIHF